MSHTWKHPAHYSQLSELRKKIHEEWKLRQIDAGQNAPKGCDKLSQGKMTQDKKPQAATKSRKPQAAAN
jgi:hypothetical protein